MWTSTSLPLLLEGWEKAPRIRSGETRPRAVQWYEHRVGRQERQLGDEVALARQPQRFVLRDREVARMKRAQRHTLEVD